MISKKRIKQLHALSLKKYRDSSGLFIAEGPKIVEELIKVLNCRYIAATERWIGTHPLKESQENIDVDIISEDELNKASLLQHPQQVMALFEKPIFPYNIQAPQTSLCLALDNIQDPGNFGTIIRIADWFGIETVFCSLDSVDIFNPKVVQATMGAISRVNVQYTDLASLIRQLPEDTPVYGTLLEGENIYAQTLSETGLVIMGNESKGINPLLRELINKTLYIPNFPNERQTSESLNVAIATAITCAEFRRRRYNL